MTIGDFIRKTKVTISNDLIYYVIDGFLKSNLAFYKPTSSLMLYLEIDKLNRGKVSSAETNSFVNRLMLDKLKNKYGAENYLLVDEETRLKNSREEIEKINTIFKKNSFVKITKDGALGEASLQYDHTFIINTKPENFIEVLNGVYEQIRDLKLDDVAILACSPNYAGLGYTAPIKINCSVESLETIMKTLDNMRYSFTSKTKKVLPIYDRMNTWYGYDQYDAHNGVEASAIFTMAIFQAVQKSFDSYLDQAVEINGVLIKDYYESQPNKLQAMRDIINNSVTLGDALIANIILNTRNELSAFGLTTTNILNVPIVEVRMQEFYGYEDTKRETFEYDPSLDADTIAKEILDEMVVEVVGKSKDDETLEVIPVETNIVIEDEKEKYVSEERKEETNVQTKEKIEVEESVMKETKELQIQPSKDNEHNPDNLEYTNPDSFCLEYQLKDGLLIPDLADIAYKGDSLKMALRSGGYVTDFDYIRDVAKHFNYDYKETKEDDLNLLNILKNLDKYYFDGTLKEEYQIVEQVSEASKEVEKKSVHPVQGETKVLRNKEEARDDDIISSISGEINKVVLGIVEQMRQVAKEIPVVDNISEVPDDQYQEVARDLRKQEKKEEYQILGKELEENGVASSKEEVLGDESKEEVLEQTNSLTGARANIQDSQADVKNLATASEGHYFVNADYLMQFSNDYDDKRKERDRLTEEELAALKQTSMATLSDSLNHLVESIKSADEESKRVDSKEEVSDERLAKYSYLVDNLEDLNKQIRNSEQTVLEYFEAEEIEKNVKGNEILNFHDHSKKTIKQFVNEYLINYLVNFGSHELSYILALYADSIEEVDVIKK